MKDLFLLGVLLGAVVVLGTRGHAIHDRFPCLGRILTSTVNDGYGTEDSQACLSDVERYFDGSAEN